jgi:WhiB family transcriptional regulator, redox-sensing transcriptional regulator
MEMESNVATDDLGWMALGRCRNLPTDTFFPSDGAGVEVARRICLDCPVKDPCREYALEHRITQGVWGATSQRQRRQLSRRRRAGHHTSA